VAVSTAGPYANLHLAQNKKPQLGHMQIYTSPRQKKNHASTLPLKFLTGRMPFLPCQSTEGRKLT